MLRHRLRPRQYAPRPFTVPVPPAPVVADGALPRIAVVTPSFEQGQFLERTIRSVLSQHYPRLQYAVQDGGSRDSSVAVLERWGPRLHAWASAPDAGQADAVNRGFARIDGDVMAWLNSDDLYLPGALRQVGEYFATHPEVDVVYGNRIVIDAVDREIGRWILPGHDQALLAWADYVPQETLFWRRRVWEAVGEHVDVTYRYALDWDLLLRFRTAGARFAHLPRFLGAFRFHSRQKTETMTHDVGAAEMERLRVAGLGFAPSRARVRWQIAPFALRCALAGFRDELARGRGRAVEVPYAAPD